MWQVAQFLSRCQLSDAMSRYRAAETGENFGFRFGAGLIGPAFGAFSRVIRATSSAFASETRVGRMTRSRKKGSIVDPSEVGGDRGWRLRGWCAAQSKR